jgi:photosystem II stability/assembly factor-like uncharacterized protein
MRILHRLQLIVLLVCISDSPLCAQYTWQATGITAATYRIALTPNDHIFIAPTGGSLYRSTDNGSSWDNVTGVWNGYGILALNTTRTGDIYVGLSGGGGAYRSTNNGTTWTQIRSALQVECIDINDHGYIFLGASTGEGAYRSTDNGTSWISINNGFGCSATVFAFVIDPSGTIFAATWCGTYRSTNDGDLWIRSDSDLPSMIPRVLTADSAGGVLIGLYSGGAYRTTDQGTHWFPINTGIISYNVNAMMVEARGAIIAGTDGGICRSTNGGTQWVDITGTLPSTNVYAVGATSNGTLFAGNGNGLYRGSQGPNAIGVDTQNAPESFALLQNYPNPFNPETRIEFRVSGAGLVSLKVFDVLGREVATLVNEEMRSGTYERTFDAGGLGSGVYMYRLQAGAYTETRKLILLK